MAKRKKLVAETRGLVNSLRMFYGAIGMYEEGMYEEEDCEKWAILNWAVNGLAEALWDYDQALRNYNSGRKYFLRKKSERDAAKGL